jgi:hypothetical protein
MDEFYATVADFVEVLGAMKKLNLEEGYKDNKSDDPGTIKFNVALQLLQTERER